ncbi:MAG: OB-fold domain-containing protein [Deltaproteobacteria bacterium]|nr:OB-fold domain-containing protein [Deltaproteobacteria bacterium]
MKDLIDKFSWQAMNNDADSMFGEYVRLLRDEKRLCSTKCKKCGHVDYPPRAFCTRCWGVSVQWIDIHESATLYAFTTQARSVRFMAPEVIGLVELPALPGPGRILSKINGKFGDLRIGQKLKFVPCPISGKLHTHSFTPVD